MLPFPQLGMSKVLVAEAVAIRAYDLEQSLKPLGCTLIGPIATGAEAIGLLHRERPDLALLDTDLRDGNLLPLARQLLSADVPFAVLAGPDDQLLEQPMLRHVPRLPRPYAPPQLHAAVRRVFFDTLTASIKRTDQRIAQAWKTIGSQARIINRLAQLDYDTGQAEELLRAYERTLGILEEQRERLARELTWHASRLRGRRPRSMTRL